MKFRNILRLGSRRSAHGPKKGGGDAFGRSLIFGGTTYSDSMAMKLSAVYGCVDVICKAVSQLPLEIFRIDSDGYKHKARTHPLFNVLNKKPNHRMTRYTLMSLWIQSSLLWGNGYAYIKRKGEGNNGEPESLIYLSPTYVTIVPPKNLIDPVQYRVAGTETLVPARDMIHIVNKSFDGVTGVSTIHYASQTLGLAHDAEKHAANFFASGCGIGGILKSSTVLKEDQAKALKEAWNKAVKDNGYNGVVVLGADLDFRALTVNPSDAQLLETRQFNVIDICRFFGVSPVKVFDLSKSSYSTVEATNISFLTDTISPLLEKIELELETKLFDGDPDIDVRFDVSQLLRADKQSLASYYSTLFQIGAINPNEIRREIDLPPIEGGNKNYVQVNLQPIDKEGAPAQELTDKNQE